MGARAHTHMHTYGDDAMSSHIPEVQSNAMIVVVVVVAVAVAVPILCAAVVIASYNMYWVDAGQSEP